MCVAFCGQGTFFAAATHRSVHSFDNGLDFDMGRDDRFAAAQNPQRIDFGFRASLLSLCHCRRRIRQCAVACRVCARRVRGDARGLRAKVDGGGDVKLLAVAFLWTGPWLAVNFAIFMLICVGIYMGGVKLGWASVDKSDRGSWMPLAPVVAGALMLTFASDNYALMLLRLLQ